MNIGAISYSISAFTFLIFLAILLTDRHKGATKTTLLVAAFINCLWSFTLAYDSLSISVDIEITLIEYFKNLSWLMLLVQLVETFFQDHRIKKVIGFLNLLVNHLIA